MEQTRIQVSGTHNGRLNFVGRDDAGDLIGDRVRIFVMARACDALEQLARCIGSWPAADEPLESGRGAVAIPCGPVRPKKQFDSSH